MSEPITPEAYNEKVDKLHIMMKEDVDKFTSALKKFFRNPPQTVEDLTELIQATASATILIEGLTLGTQALMLEASLAPHEVKFEVAQNSIKKLAAIEGEKDPSLLSLIPTQKGVH